jgi:hypothetical protein
VGEGDRRQFIREAYRQISETGHATCSCGQLFLTEDGYAEHVMACEYRKRGQLNPAAADMTNDEVRPKGK